MPPARLLMRQNRLGIALTSRATPAVMSASSSARSPVSAPEAGLRIALFSGNYNYTADGVNRTLNRLVRFLEARGVDVLVGSPTAAKPAFEPAGELLSAPSFPLPGRAEYRFSLGLPGTIRDRLAAFRPHLVHITAPDLLCLGARRQAQAWGLPVLATYHTRFDSYFSHYGLGFLHGSWQRYARSFYGACDRVLAPSASMAELLTSEGIAPQIGVWGRGVDSDAFSPALRSPEWRRSIGLGDKDIAILFTGRLVREKGLDPYIETLQRLTDRRGNKVRAVIVGDGPERKRMESALPTGIFTGFLTGKALARAYASADIFFNPSRSETFGNVTLEAMASGLPGVCADATGSRDLIDHGKNGFLIRDDGWEYAERLLSLIDDETLRERMARTARDTAVQRDWDGIMQQMLSHYLDLTGRMGAQRLAA